jgi:N-acetylneuraminic acid mutarotase
MQNSEWELIETHGTNKPPKLSNHSSVEHGGKMYLFGGSNLNSENLAMHTLDLNRFQWNLLKPKAANGDESNLPHTRDEHSCVVHNDSMIVFGGFAFGERSNSIFRYNFRMNTWEKINHKGSAAPCPRAGHSAVIR